MPAFVATVACCVTILFSPVATAGYTGVSVFGDSLSDGGNVFTFSGGTFPPPPYAQRLTNGPTAVEVMAANLGLPLTPSLLGGRNYAYGGAETGLGNYFRVSPDVPPIINLIFSGLPPFPPTGTLAQVQGFGGTIAPQDLTVLWAGPNDFFTALVLGQNPADAIGPALANLSQSAGLLYAAGARTILMPDMPNLGATPFALSTGNAPGLTALTVAFNTFLDLTIDQLEMSLPGLDIVGSTRSDCSARSSRIRAHSVSRTSRIPASTESPSAPIRISTSSGTSSTRRRARTAFWATRSRARFPNPLRSRSSVSRWRSSGQPPGPEPSARSTLEQSDHLPSASMSILDADGSFGSPGIVITSPQIITMNSAPAASRTSRMLTTWPDGAPRSPGSVENEYCVFATQTG
jgi:hypothetical protein